MTDTTLPPDMRNAAVATFDTEAQAEEAVRSLERGGFPMDQLSIVARGMSSERHVMGFDTKGRRVGRWTGFGAGWGALWGALFFIPGVGHVALGGYLLFILATGAIGAGTGALTAALTSLGVPDDAVIRYESAVKADKYLLVAHGAMADVEHAREILSGSPAGSVDVHHGEPAAV